ncbi:hypothetical protein Leryth_008868 [Lithospermum erythrorhizon]|nr:hypothetical protein Leryth_008868 [Lithospermum erythrorhizon]
MLGTPLPWPPVSPLPPPHPLHHHLLIKPSSFSSPYSSKPPQPLTSPYKPHSKTSQFLPRFQLSLSEQPPLQPLFTSKPLLSPKSQSLNFSYLINISVKYNDIQLTKAIHSSIIKIKDDVYLYNALIIAYLRLGEFSYARKVFYAIVSPDVVSYTALISGFVKVNCENEAIGLFLEMRRLGIEPNGYSFVALLSACMRLFDVEFGFQVHAYLLKLGYLCCTYVGNALMGLYSKCGCSDFVIELFDYMLVRDVASWNTAISCMVKESMFDSAFELFRKMFEINGLGADDYTISSLLCACGGCSAVMKGRELHAHAIKIGYESNLNVNNALIGFYSKLGSLKEVKSLFESVPQRDVYTWTEMVTAYMKFGIVDAAVEVFEKIPCKNCVSYNALLAGFCNNGEGSRAFNLFCTMVEEGVELTDYALTSALNACGLMKQRGTSEQIHAFVLKVGCGKNEHIEASLIDMCTRCDRMRDAEQMYHKLGLDLINSVMLTTMICAYARNGQPEEAFSLFCKYKSEIYLVADEALVAAIIGVCGTLGLHDLET